MQFQVLTHIDSTIFSFFSRLKNINEAWEEIGYFSLSRRH